MLAHLEQCRNLLSTGDLIIAWGAIRDEYTSQQYIPLEFPAVADLDVTLALRQAARNIKVRHHIGMTQYQRLFLWSTRT